MFVYFAYYLPRTKQKLFHLAAACAGETYRDEKKVDYAFVSNKR